MGNDFVLSDMKPSWARGVRRTICDHPDEIPLIMDYLRKHGDLRSNAKKVELLWVQFSRRSGESFRAVTDIALQNFAVWLESGMDENDYYTVEEQYSEWEKSSSKSKEVPMISDS